MTPSFCQAEIRTVSASKRGSEGVSAAYNFDLELLWIDRRTALPPLLPQFPPSRNLSSCTCTQYRQYNHKLKKADKGTPRRNCLSLFESQVQSTTCNIFSQISVDFRQAL